MTLQTDQRDSQTPPSCRAGRQSTVEPIIKRSEAGLFAALFLAASVFLPHVPGSGLLKYPGAALGLLCGLAFFISALCPARAQRGVVLVDGGFEHFAGLHGKRLVHFADIERIIAVQSGGGAEGDEVLLEIFCGNTKVLLGERDLFGTDLHRILFELPGFGREQYSDAANYRLKGLENLRGKRFNVLRKF